MQRQVDLTKKLKTVFNGQQAAVLSEVITDAYSDLVKTGDFNELKAIVKELAEAQKRTEQRVEELAEAQKETQLAMKETQLAMKETQLAMKETQLAMKETQQEIKTLTKRVGETNSTLGGLGQSVAYALENEAYRMLPGLLKEKYGIEVAERFVRTYVGGEEINLFGRGKRNGRDVLIVGESKSRLDERRRQKKGRKDFFEQLEKKAQAVRTEHPAAEIVRVVITHYARPEAVKQAQEEEIIVVQSFEW